MIFQVYLVLGMILLSLVTIPIFYMGVHLERKPMFSNFFYLHNRSEIKKDTNLPDQKIVQMEFFLPNQTSPDIQIGLLKEKEKQFIEIIALKNFPPEHFTDCTLIFYKSPNMDQNLILHEIEISLIYDRTISHIESLPENFSLSQVQSYSIIRHYDQTILYKGNLP